VRGLLIESKAIGSDEVDIYMSSRYPVTTIVPLEESPVMNVYLFTKEELNHFLRNTTNMRNSLVLVERAEAMV
jgi:hypothetical protein